MKTYTMIYESEPLYVHIIGETPYGMLTALISWAGVEAHAVFPTEADIKAFLANQNRVASFVEQMCHSSF